MSHECLARATRVGEASSSSPKWPLHRKRRRSSRIIHLFPESPCSHPASCIAWACLSCAIEETNGTAFYSSCMAASGGPIPSKPEAEVSPRQYRAGAFW
jgi:hypothetical protein